MRNKLKSDQICIFMFYFFLIFFTILTLFIFCQNFLKFSIIYQITLWSNLVISAYFMITLRNKVYSENNNQEEVTEINEKEQINMIKANIIEPENEDVSLQIENTTLNIKEDQNELNIEEIRKQLTKFCEICQKDKVMHFIFTPLIGIKNKTLQSLWNLHRQIRPSLLFNRWLCWPKKPFPFLCLFNNSINIPSTCPNNPH